MKTIAELRKIFYRIDDNPCYDRALWILKTFHDIDLDNNEQNYYNNLYHTSKKNTDTSDPKEGCKEFLKLYYNSY